MDGDMTTDSHTDTGSNDWLIVHLPNTFRVYDIIVVNGKVNQHYYRLNGAEVILLTNGERIGSCGTISTRRNYDTIEDQTYTLSCGGITATSVKIQQSGTETLAVMEVKVQGRSMKKKRKKKNVFSFSTYNTIH